MLFCAVTTLTKDVHRKPTPAPMSTSAATANASTSAATTNAVVLTIFHRFFCLFAYGGSVGLPMVEVLVDYCTVFK